MVGLRLHRRDRLFHLRDGHGDRAEDAEAAGGAGRRGETRARDPAHAGLDDRIAATEQIAYAGMESAHDAATSFAPRPVGSMTVRSRCSSSSVGSRVTGTGSANTSGKPVFSRTSASETPGWMEASRIAWSGVAKSRTARSVTTRRI